MSLFRLRPLSTAAARQLRVFSTSPLLRADAPSQDNFSSPDATAASGPSTPSSSTASTRSSPFDAPKTAPRPARASLPPLSRDDFRRAEEPARALPTSELDAAGLDAKWKALSEDEIKAQDQHQLGGPKTPYSSRTFLLSGNMGVSVVQSAWKRLNRVLMESGIRRELRLTERYEQPSLKRQRLASERHRRRFKAQVGKEITDIMRLKKKGL